MSNPIYYALLARVGADLDDSLPGVAWLRAIYGRIEMICTLPGLRNHLRAHWDRAWRRQVAARAAPKPDGVPPAQRDLFAAAPGACA